MGITSSLHLSDRMRDMKEEIYHQCKNATKALVKEKHERIAAKEEERTD